MTDEPRNGPESGPPDTIGGRPARLYDPARQCRQCGRMMQEKRDVKRTNLPDLLIVETWLVCGCGFERWVGSRTAADFYW